MAPICAGGAVIMWYRRVLGSLESVVGMYSVSFRWGQVEHGFEWACFWLYGPNDNRGISLDSAKMGGCLGVV